MMSEQRLLSLRIYEILEKVGASEKMRNLHKRVSTTRDILETIEYTITCNKLIHFYTCGSAYEGSITPDLSSDRDTVVCDMYLPVVLDQHAATHGASLLMVTDAGIHPGYVKLQRLWNGILHTANDYRPDLDCDVDGVGRLCLRHFLSVNNNSPAIKHVDSKGVHFIDQVPALKCNTLPLFVGNRLDRLRHRMLISEEELSKLKNMGCLFVAAGHFLSLERNIEWRLSLSLQERHLMSKLNPTQHKVYILLKIIKVNIIEKVLKCKVFTSYHCKTCVLYAVEMTPRQSWAPGNLMNCLMQCIKLLMLWLRNNYCPNYFIQNQNLFSKRNFSYFRHSLLQTMKLLCSNNQYLQLLQTDHIWTLLLEGECQWRNVVDLKKSEHMFDIKLSTIRTSVSNVPRYICKLVRGRYSVFSLTGALESLQQTDTITEHTATETQSALRYLYPWFHLHIAKSLASMSFRLQDRSYSKRTLKVADVHFRKAAFTDLVNFRLAKATILYLCEQYETCFLLLQQIENDFTYKVFRMCPCERLYSMEAYDEQDKREICRSMGGISVRNIMKCFVACCVVFLPSEFHIVPIPLQYEMFRSCGTHPGSRNERKHFWFDWCVIDARIYLYFMQYLVCSELQKRAHKQVAMDNIRAVIKEDNLRVLLQYDVRQLDHRETAYNILGWIYLQEQRFGDAVQCFLKSWEIRPFHNAAKFHMRDLLDKVSEEH